MNTYQSLLEGFLSLFYPNCCLACNQPMEANEAHICTICQYRIPKTDYHLFVENELSKRFYGRIPLRRSLAYLKYHKSGIVQRLLHRLKYHGNKEIGEILGRWYGRELTEHGYLHEFDLILPVPLHPSKLKKRGYNQSAVFAAGLSESLQVPCFEDLLIRTSATETQTKKDKINRWLNVATVFAVSRPEEVEGRNLLLVDDVVTTGATLEACAQVLINCGCKSVSIATIATAQS